MFCIVAVRHASPALYINRLRVQFGTLPRMSVVPKSTPCFVLIFLGDVVPSFRPSAWSVLITLYNAVCTRQLLLQVHSKYYISSSVLSVPLSAGVLRTWADIGTSGFDPEQCMLYYIYIYIYKCLQHVFSFGRY